MPFSQQILRVMDYILVTASIVKILNSSLIDANKVNFLHSSWSSSKCIQVKSEVDTDCITAFELEFKQQTFFFPRISFDHIPCSSLRRNEKLPCILMNVSICRNFHSVCCNQRTCHCVCDCGCP